MPNTKSAINSYKRKIFDPPVNNRSITTVTILIKQTALYKKNA